MNALGFDGTWVGQNKLWFEDPKVPELSETRMTIVNNRIAYTWSFRGKAQSGEMVFSPRGGEVSAEWTDTWHSQKPMSCIGTANDGRVNVLGYYEGGGEQWGWRTEIFLAAPKHLMLRMYNVDPQGAETLAVEMDCAG